MQISYMEVNKPKSAVNSVDSPNVGGETRISDVTETYFSDGSNKTTKRTTTKLENIGEDGRC